MFQDYIKRYLRGIWVFLQLTCEYYIGEYPVSFLSLHPKSDICYVLHMKSLIILLQHTSAYLCILFVVCVQLV